MFYFDFAFDFCFCCLFVFFALVVVVVVVFKLVCNNEFFRASWYKCFKNDFDNVS